LHNLGQIVLLSHEEIGPRYMDVMARIRDAGVDFATAERDVIGFSHPLVGALVARKWGFPDPACMTILRYADPFDGVGSRQDEQIALVQLATELALGAGIGHPPGYPLNGDRLAPVATAVGFAPDTLVNDLDQLGRQTRERFQAEANAYA
jgi:hypothetical protein